MGKIAGYGFRFGVGEGTGLIQVSRDHIFESESSRDTYFMENLNELVTGTPVVVNIGSEVVFDVWTGTTEPNSYDSSQWARMTIPDNFTELSDTPNTLTGSRLVKSNSAGNALIFNDPLTENRILAADGEGGLKNTNHRIMENDLFIAGRLLTESGTISVGDVVSVSESGGFLSIENAIDGRRYNLLDYHVPTTAASSKPRRLALTGAESRVVVSSGSGDSIQTRSIDASYTAAGTGRINALIINTNLGYENLRIRISNVSPGNPTDIKYIPSRQAWLDGTGGLTETTSGEKTIRIDDSPLVYDNGRQYTISYRYGGTSADLLGEGSTPFLAILAQTGSFLEIADDNDVPDDFTDLDDTPSSLGTAGQFINVNSDATALQFVDSPIDWDHANLTTGRMPSNNRRWYTFTGTTNVSIQLPDESGIESGWHCFVGNDSTSSTIILMGDFRGDVNRISLLPQEGCLISYDGSIFLEGPARQIITVSNFPEWDSNPLFPSRSYTDPDNSNSWSSGATGVNVNNENIRIHMLNAFVRYAGGTDYVFDLPVLSGSNTTEVPIGSGFAIINQGAAVLSVRPLSTNTIIRRNITHNNINPILLSTGATVTIVRQTNDNWNVTVQSGTITGGTTS